MNIGQINIEETIDTAVITIDGVIGIPEACQFGCQGERVSAYETFKKRLQQINDLKAGTIYVDIRSTGGDVNDAILIYEALKATNAEIITRCYGYVGSAATIIAQAGSKDARYLSENSLYLIHLCTASVEGNCEDMQNARDTLNELDSKIAHIYGERAGKWHSEYILLMSENNGNGRWLSPFEAIKYGLADQIIQE